MASVKSSEVATLKARSARYDSILILVLLIIILSGFLWILVFYYDTPKKRTVDSGASKKEAQPVRQVRTVKNMVTDVKAVALDNGSLKVTFSTKKPALTELSAGYNSLSPKYRKVSGYAHELTHTLIARKLLPGQVYYVISGTLKNGDQFREPARIALISAPETKKKPLVAPDGTSGKNVQEGTAPVDVVTSEGSTSAVDSPGTPAEGGNVEYAEPEVARRPMPNISSDTPLAKRAISASTIERTFGPESLESLSREKLEEHIEWLHGEFEKYKDARGLRELGEAYYEYRDYRKALRYATKAVKLDDKDVDCHLLRLKIYKKFAMGWKVQETQEKIRKLVGTNTDNEHEFNRNDLIYGEFKTRGTPEVVSIK